MTKETLPPKVEIVKIIFLFYTPLAVKDQFYNSEKAMGDIRPVFAY